MPLVLDMQKISTASWSLFQDSCGRLLDEYSVRKWTFYEGISPEARPEVWKFVLGYYPFLSTREERAQIDKEKRKKYQELLESWQQSEGGPQTELSNYIRVINKDCVRTDRSHASFNGNGQEATENINALKRILPTFVVYNPELGYVQGMNEFLSPLYLVLGSEHQAFWCLAEVLRRMTDVFTDLTLSQPLATLSRLCYYADTQLHNHISEVHKDNDWIFCYRGVLLNFKREFSMEDVFSLWEIIWCNHLTKYFQLFVAVAMLVHNKQELLLCTSVESFMQFAMGLCCNVPLTPILTIARALAEQLKGDEYCPHELRYLVSDEGCAPPPLIGFVRARQRFSTLHSNKLTGNDIWKSLFGETSVQPITSPFILSRNASAHGFTELTLRSPITQQNTSPSYSRDRAATIGHVGQDNDRTQSTQSSFCPPPKLGFIPRTGFAFSAHESLGYQKGVRVMPPCMSPVTTRHQHTSPLPSEREVQTFSNSQPMHDNTMSCTHSRGFSSSQVYGVNGATSHSNVCHSNGVARVKTGHSQSTTQLMDSSISSQHDSTFSRSGSTGDIVYYNHHTEQLSGGVFDDTIVNGEEVLPGSEFDCLRSEAALDIQ